MPNDDLFSDQQPPNQADNGSASTSSAQPPAAAPALEQQLGSLTATLSALAKAQEGTNARVEQLASAVVERQAPAGDDDDAAEPTDAAGKPLSPQAKKFSKFYENPEEFIQAEAKKLVQAQLGPHLLNQATQRGQELEQRQRELIDGQFGAGTWDKHYAADFQQILGKNVEMRASREHVEAAVQAIHGRRFLADDTRADLESRRAAVAKARAEANYQPPAMLGNGMPSQRRAAGQLTAEQAELIETLRRNGIPYSKEQYLAAQEKGSKASAWAKPAKGTTTNNGKQANA